MEDDAIDHLASALQPIVGVLQERTIGVGEWIEAVKIASYRAAHQSTDAETGRAVFSKMSIRTGMSRAELTQVRKRMALGSEGRRATNRNRLARVVDGWLSHPDYTDSNGAARPLSAEGPEPNLHSLSRAYGGDVPPVSLVVELRRYGLIREVGAGYYMPLLTYRKQALRGAAKIERFMRNEASALVSALRLEMDDEPG